MDLPATILHRRPFLDIIVFQLVAVFLTSSLNRPRFCFSIQGTVIFNFNLHLSFLQHNRRSAASIIFENPHSFIWLFVWQSYIQYISFYCSLSYGDPIHSQSSKCPRLDFVGHDWQYTSIEVDFLFHHSFIRFNIYLPSNVLFFISSRAFLVSVSGMYDATV